MSADLVPLRSSHPLVVEHNETQMLVNPESGEALAQDSPAASIAAFVEAVRAWEQDARAAKQIASDWIHERMDRERLWSLRDGDYELKGTSDAEVVEWNVPALVELLKALVSEGKISQDAADAAIRYEPKVQKRGLDALRKNRSLAELIDACGEAHAPMGRRLTISRKKP